MRLGAWPCKLEPNSFAAKAYGTTEISERHRHRYEFNCQYEPTLTEAGFRISGRTPDGKYVEIVEIPDHPWFVGCQFHPEFKSKPLAPHPLFAAFVHASLENRRLRLGQPTDAVAAESRMHLGPDESPGHRASAAGS
jgi:CTP synthase